jgi:two-component system OmpR family sensor kinase
MVWNLIENSAKYADRNQPIELALTSDRGRKQLQLQVADRGGQLSSEQCQAIFAPFYRLAAAKQQVGSGLGLTLVRRYAETLGGAVSATAREGGGLIVSLCLPQAGQGPWPEHRIRQPQTIDSNPGQVAGGGTNLSATAAS